jgi:hypothetical protein
MIRFCWCLDVGPACFVPKFIVPACRILSSLGGASHVLWRETICARGDTTLSGIPYRYFIEMIGVVVA